MSYFVYGEKVDTYSFDLDPLQKEFMEVGAEYIEGIIIFLYSWPIYRLYPNQTYRKYVKAMKRLHGAGWIAVASCSLYENYW